MAARHVQLHSPHQHQHQNQHQLQAFSRVSAAHAWRVQPNPRRGFVRVRSIVGRVRIVPRDVAPRVRILSASCRAGSRAAADAGCTRRSMAWQFLDANAVQPRVSLWTRVRLHSTCHNLSEATSGNTRSQEQSLLTASVSALFQSVHINFKKFPQPQRSSVRLSTQLNRRH